MAVTYKGMPHRKRRLAPEIKFGAKKKQEPLMIPMQKISKPVLESAEEGVLQEVGVDKDIKPIVSDSEPAAEKPKKRGRPAPAMVLIEYTGERKRPFTVLGYEFSSLNRIQAVGVADVEMLLKRRSFRRKT